MGYRSDVTIRCEEKAFQMFKTAYEVFDDFYVVVDVNLPSVIREVQGVGN